MSPERIADLTAALGDALDTSAIVTTASRNLSVVYGIAVVGGGWAVLDQFLPSLPAAVGAGLLGGVAVVPAIAWWRVTAVVTSLSDALHKVTTGDFDVLDRERWRGVIDRLRGDRLEVIRGLFDAAKLLTVSRSEGQAIATSATAAVSRLPSLLLFAVVASVAIGILGGILIPAGLVALAV